MNPEEERVRSLYAAAHPPAYPSIEPSNELERRVAELAARHDARAARLPQVRQVRDDPNWTSPWDYAGGRTAAEAIMAAHQRYRRYAPHKVSCARDGYFSVGGGVLW